MNASKTLLVSSAIFALLFATPSPAGVVSPVFVGTKGMGNTTPAACVPFGMVQAGPDTSPWAERAPFGKQCSGYQFGDGFLWRFSQTHVSGTGVSAGGNIAILPQLGGDRGESAAMDKATEAGEPGYYAVTLKNGIRCEATANEHVAVYRFTYPQGKAAALLLDLDWGLMESYAGGYDTFSRIVRGDVCRFDSPTVCRGYQHLRCYTEYTVHYAAEFSAPVTSQELVREADGVRGDVWRFGFGVPEGGVLEVRIALSFTSQAGAKRNLAAERASFDETRQSAALAWEDWFARYRAEGGDADAAANLRAALYHLGFQPNLKSDVGEKPRYMNFSLWDTFRAAHPLYTILAPERVDGFMNSLLDEYDTRGYLPILSFFGRDSHCMIGHHAAPVLADAYLKGFRGFDGKKVLRAMNHSYRHEHVPESTACWGFMKEDWWMLDRFGYYPFDILRTWYRGALLRGESVSRTLECAYDDSCVARLAMALGDRESADYFARRSGCWTNVFDRTVGFARGRDSHGRWREPFDPAVIGFGPFADRDFTEGNSWQYSWHVMHDPAGLIAAMGGSAKTTAKLDALFATQAGMGEDDRSYDVTGLIGQYAHGNEPSHHVAYFYPFVGRPDRTAEVVREVFDRFYHPRPDGLCGNDDCGQMSAWYLFSAAGFYPFDPCGGDFVLGAPQVEKVSFSLPSGKVFKVVAKNLSKANKYVKSVTLNGRRLDRCDPYALTYAEMMKGGELVFEMVGK